MIVAFFNRTKETEDTKIEREVDKEIDYAEKLEETEDFNEFLKNRPFTKASIDNAKEAFKSESNIDNTLSYQTKLLSLQRRYSTLRSLCKNVVYQLMTEAMTTYSEDFFNTINTLSNDIYIITKDIETFYYTIRLANERVHGSWDPWLDRIKVQEKRFNELSKLSDEDKDELSEEEIKSLEEIKKFYFSKVVRKINDFSTMKSEAKALVYDIRSDHGAFAEFTTAVDNLVNKVTASEE